MPPQLSSPSNVFVMDTILHFKIFTQLHCCKYIHHTDLFLWFFWMLFLYMHPSICDNGNRIWKYVSCVPERYKKAFNFSLLCLKNYLNHSGTLTKNISRFAQAWKELEFRGFSWKLNLPWKVLVNHSKALKSPWILLFSVGLSTVDRDRNQYKTVVPIFGAAYAAPNIGTTILY